MDHADQSSDKRLGASELIDLYFLDARHKLLDIAAFIDRVERAAADEPGGEDDYRIAALRRAAEALAGGEPDRAKAIQMIFSDPTTEPLESAAGMQGATGAYNGSGTDE